MKSNYDWLLLAGFHLRSSTRNIKNSLLQLFFPFVPSANSKICFPGQECHIGHLLGCLACASRPFLCRTLLNQWFFHVPKKPSKVETSSCFSPNDSKCKRTSNISNPFLSFQTRFFHLNKLLFLNFSEDSLSPRTLCRATFNNFNFSIVQVSCMHSGPKPVVP